MPLVWILVSVWWVQGNNEILLRSYATEAECLQAAQGQTVPGFPNFAFCTKGYSGQPPQKLEE